MLILSIVPLRRQYEKTCHRHGSRRLRGFVTFGGSGSQATRRKRQEKVERHHQVTGDYEIYPMDLSRSFYFTEYYYSNSILQNIDL